MKVSLSTLLEISNMLRTSFGSAQPIFILKKAASVQTNQSMTWMLVGLLVFLTMVILATLASIVAVQGLLKEEECQISIQAISVRPAVIQEDRCSSKAGQTLALESIPEILDSESDAQCKASNGDRSTEYAEDHSFDIHGHAPELHKGVEKRMEMLLSAGRKSFYQKLIALERQEIKRGENKARFDLACSN